MVEVLETKFVTVRDFKDYHDHQLAFSCKINEIIRIKTGTVLKLLRGVAVFQTYIRFMDRKGEVFVLSGFPSYHDLSSIEGNKAQIASLKLTGSITCNSCSKTYLDFV